MDKIYIVAITEEGESVFSGSTIFVPRIGEEVRVGRNKYVVQNVSYPIRSFGDTQANLTLKKIG